MRYEVSSRAGIFAQLAQMSDPRMRESPVQPGLRTTSVILPSATPDVSPIEEVRASLMPIVVSEGAK